MIIKPVATISNASSKIHCNASTAHGHYSISIKVIEWNYSESATQHVQELFELCGEHWMTGDNKVFFYGL